MQSLVYHVATTLDGFIARPDGSAPGFAFEGAHVDAYRRHLEGYAAIVMGRATYEIGYAYGMKPGDLPYGDRPHFVFSSGQDLPAVSNLTVVREEALPAIDRIKAEADGPVYLCGGGRFAGHLLAHDRIDSLMLKVSPLVYGQGIRLFEGHDGLKSFELASVTSYDTGVLLLEYRRARS